MKKIFTITAVLAIAAGLFFTSCDKSDSDSSLVVNFDSLTIPTAGYWNGSDNSGSFKVNGISFPNVYTTSAWGDYWSGFAYSAKHDIHTEGYGNQYSSYVLSDSASTNKFVVAYPSSGSDKITFDNLVYDVSLKVSNTSYAALSMKNGDSFSKKFTGPTESSTGDWFKLMIIGMDEAGASVDTAAVYLADFRSSTTSLQYIANEWIPVSLSFFNQVKALKFELSSSDNGSFGMNTPGYFCLDDIEYKVVKTSK